jgi:hypothetical protein
MKSGARLHDFVLTRFLHADRRSTSPENTIEPLLASGAEQRSSPSAPPFGSAGKQNDGRAAFGHFIFAGFVQAWIRSGLEKSR